MTLAATRSRHTFVPRNPPLLALVGLQEPLDGLLMDLDQIPLKTKRSLESPDKQRVNNWVK
jgi:hypothetical protein